MRLRAWRAQRFLFSAMLFVIGGGGWLQPVCAGCMCPLIRGVICALGELAVVSMVPRLCESLVAMHRRAANYVDKHKSALPRV